MTEPVSAPLPPEEAAALAHMTRAELAGLTEEAIGLRGRSARKMARTIRAEVRPRGPRGWWGWWGFGTPIHESSAPLPDTLALLVLRGHQRQKLSGEDLRRIAANVDVPLRRVRRAVRTSRQARKAGRALGAALRPWEQPAATKGKRKRRPERGPERRRA